MDETTLVRDVAGSWHATKTGLSLLRSRFSKICVIGSGKGDLPTSRRRCLPLRKLSISAQQVQRPVRRVHASEFIGDVRQIASFPDDSEVRRAVVSVFAALQKMVGSPKGLEGETWNVMNQLRAIPRAPQAICPARWENIILAKRNPSRRPWSHPCLLGLKNP